VQIRSTKRNTSTVLSVSMDYAPLSHVVNGSHFTTQHHEQIASCSSLGELRTWDMHCGLNGNITTLYEKTEISPVSTTDVCSARKITTTLVGQRRDHQLSYDDISNSLIVEIRRAVTTVSTVCGTCCNFRISHSVF